ncbi:hypothetical protein [Sphingomonas echinoides]|uniref:hypothetical protein n=1 Tax=Sphingomonas echinoides TaxID=59803 RepID=UPI002413B08D|nr:hypothetical protein [Sphingomonas echinoides]
MINADALMMRASDFPGLAKHGESAHGFIIGQNCQLPLLGGFRNFRAAFVAVTAVSVSLFRHSARALIRRRGPSLFIAIGMICVLGGVSLIRVIESRPRSNPAEGERPA